MHSRNEQGIGEIRGSRWFRSRNRLWYGLLSVFVLILTAGPVAFASGFPEGRISETTDPRERPNLLVVFVDDLDQTPFGFMGNPIISTPNIDKLAERGVVFDNAFAVTPICQTSRGNLMTGQYAARTGIYMESFSRLEERQIPMIYPKILHDSGYYTGYVGKWHLGPLPEGVLDDDRRFMGQGQFWSKEYPPEEGFHLTDRLGDQMVDMIRQAPGDQPFAFTIGFKAPHVQDGFHPVEPYPASPSTAFLYERDEIPAPPLSDSAFFAGQPDFIRSSLGRERWRYRLGPPESLNFQRSMRRYYRMVTGVDQQLGKIVQVLRERNQLEHTIILFTSDHGMYRGERGLAGKWLLHDTSVRIPFLVADPGLPASRRGEHREQMALMIDIMPTLLEWAGVSIPDRVQGRSLAPIVRGEAVEDWRTEFFMEHHSFGNRIPRSEGVRTERYKYIRYLDSEPIYEELYDLEADPVERQNLAPDPAHESLLQEMRDKWSQHKERVK